MKHFWRGLTLLGALAIISVASNGVAEAGSASMITGSRTTQPVGHYEFCQREPEQCVRISASREPVKLTKRVWRMIVAVNDAVNKEVEPRTDQEMWGREEVWSFPTSVGDCEDYALEKRRRLIALGISPAALPITVVRQSNGEGHAVLTVRTSDGDYILDNLETDVRLWTDTSYTYLKRQSDRSSAAWVAIDDGRQAVAVGSVR